MVARSNPSAAKRRRAASRIAVLVGCERLPKRTPTIVGQRVLTWTPEWCTVIVNKRWQTLVDRGDPDVPTAFNHRRAHHRRWPGWPGDGRLAGGARRRRRRRRQGGRRREYLSRR